jgi:hypothetical protein
MISPVFLACKGWSSLVSFFLLIINELVNPQTDQDETLTGESSLYGKLLHPWISGTGDKAMS